MIEKQSEDAKLWQGRWTNTEEKENRKVEKSKEGCWLRLGHNVQHYPRLLPSAQLQRPGPVRPMDRQRLGICEASTWGMCLWNRKGFQKPSYKISKRSIKNKIPISPPPWDVAWSPIKVKVQSPFSIWGIKDYFQSHGAGGGVWQDLSKWRALRTSALLQGWKSSPARLWLTTATMSSQAVCPPQDSCQSPRAPQKLAQPSQTATLLYLLCSSANTQWPLASWDQNASCQPKPLISAFNFLLKPWEQKFRPKMYYLSKPDTQMAQAAVWTAGERRYWPQRRCYSLGTQKDILARSTKMLNTLF